jgi:hypothetical protein
VTVYAQKTRIVFQARVRFAGAVVHNDWLEAALWLKRSVEHPCLHRVESFGPLGYGVHFRLTKLNDIDRELEVFIREAYAENATVPTGHQLRVPNTLHPTAAGRRGGRPRVGRSR